MPHIVATISGHGLGHLSISAPVLNELSKQITDVELTVLTGLDEQQVRNRLTTPFNYGHSAVDFGVLMNGDLSVRVEDTAKAYDQLHVEWERHVADYARTLDASGCDLVLSNVSYLSIAAARYAGIPALAVCSLNWWDMYSHYCGGARDYPRIHRHMQAAYESAEAFLKITPSMPMDRLNNTRQIGPIAATTTSRRQWIVDRLGLRPDVNLVVVAMGGHDARYPAALADDPSVCWLVFRSEAGGQTNVFAFEQLDLPFLDILASSDLLVTKPGYGSFVEATCMNKPVLYLTRPDWPEEHYLVEWLAQNNACKQLTPDRFESGAFIDDVNLLLNQRPRTPVAATGISQCVDIIKSALGGDHGVPA